MILELSEITRRGEKKNHELEMISLWNLFYHQVWYLDYLKSPGVERKTYMNLKLPPFENHKFRNIAFLNTPDFGISGPPPDVIFIDRAF